MHRDIQRDGEIDTEMMIQTHIHRNGERETRRARNKCKRNAIPQDHTSSRTGCALSNSKECHFHICHDVTAPPELCNSASLLGFSVHGILQARILEWVTISFSRGSF